MGRPINPPLALTADAVVGRLRHFATNGPTYIQFQSTKTLARILRLFDKASDALQQLGLAPDQNPSPDEPSGPDFITSEDQITEEDDNYL
jgi:hypothetical protein